jgi:hypothetical protein
VSPTGFRYWLFGDTILGFPGEGSGFAPERTMVSNTILIQRGAELGPATWSNGTAAVPDVGGHRYWTTDILFSEPGGSAYVLCQRTHNGPDGFVTDGAEIAEFFTDAGGGRLTFARMWPTPTVPDVLETTEIQWSLGWERDPSGYLYVYGYRQAGAAPGYTTPHRTYVARVDAEFILVPRMWEFWDGLAWTVDKAEAAPILDGQLTSVRRIGGKWVFAYKPWNAYGDTVLVQSGLRPEGPPLWSLSVPSPGGTTPAGHPYWTYNPTLHEVSPGKTLLSISHNGEFADIFAERSLYRPEWLEVTLP